MILSVSSAVVFVLRYTLDPKLEQSRIPQKMAMLAVGSLSAVTLEIPLTQFLSELWH
jgi:predicted MFS family arabinose efflux permease